MDTRTEISEALQRSMEDLIQRVDPTDSEPVFRRAQGRAEGYIRAIWDMGILTSSERDYMMVQVANKK